MFNNSLISPSCSSNKGNTAFISYFWSSPIESSYLLLFLARYMLSIVLWVLAKDWRQTFHGFIIEPSYLLTLSPYPTTGNVSTKSNWLLQNYKPYKRSGSWKTYFWFCKVNIETYWLLGFSESFTRLNVSEN